MRAVDESPSTFWVARYRFCSPGKTHGFLDPDWTIPMLRAARGERIGLAITTHHSGHGMGMAHAAVCDVDGRVGSSNQSLLVDVG